MILTQVLFALRAELKIKLSGLINKRGKSADQASRKHNLASCLRLCALLTLPLIIRTKKNVCHTKGEVKVVKLGGSFPKSHSGTQQVEREREREKESDTPGSQV